jgi:hypothetical protein
MRRGSPDLNASVLFNEDVVDPAPPHVSEDVFEHPLFFGNILGCERAVALLPCFCCCCSVHVFSFVVWVCFFAPASLLPFSDTKPETSRPGFGSADVDVSVILWAPVESFDESVIVDFFEGFFCVINENNDDFLVGGTAGDCGLDFGHGGHFTSS